MTDFKVENFLVPISPESPCGKNLEDTSSGNSEDLKDNAAFTQLEIAAKFIEKREQGESIIPEVMPDWKKVRELSIELLGKSRDIQVSMHLTCALLWTEGFTGFVHGLSLIQGLLDNYWQDVYPRQAPEDKYPILRVNTLETLKDYRKVLAPLARTKLTQSKTGQFSWRDIESANNLTSASNTEEVPDPLIIEAAFLDTDPSILKQQEQAIKQALDLTQKIVDLIAEKAGSMNAPDFSKLTNLLKNIDKYLAEKIQQRDNSGQEIDDPISQTPDKPSVRSNTDGIQSREEVIRALDAICKYFERNEPSSPIPFLMLRAKKLLSMNFMEILRDMAPDAVNQAEKICGANQDDKN